MLMLVDLSNVILVTHLFAQHVYNILDFLTPNFFLELQRSNTESLMNIEMLFLHSFLSRKQQAIKTSSNIFQESTPSRAAQA